MAADRRLLARGFKGMMITPAAARRFRRYGHSLRHARLLAGRPDVMLVQPALRKARYKVAPA